ncbi:hypothetical protein BCR44DRAFT_38565 [Catenaria anguillulae PL171]|uniref:Uncharacterized protein n=1 Tax=Catenaria anguillulae PL171 TaxID=765915 RepID=A0A1Y2HRA7_9FUNG|nr:hypothetical protein BCR44DRAFT_38565 [Catenaria anguillulae PL171]
MDTSNSQSPAAPELPIELCEDIVAHVVKIEGAVEAERRRVRLFLLRTGWHGVDGSEQPPEDLPPRLYTFLNVFLPRPSFTKFALAEGIKPSAYNLALVGSLKGLRLLYQVGHSEQLDDQCFWIAAICEHVDIVRWWIETGLPIDKSIQTKEEKTNELALLHYDYEDPGWDEDEDYLDQFVDEEELSRQFSYEGVSAATSWLIARKAAIIDRFASSVGLSPSLARVLGKARLKKELEEAWLESTDYVDHHGTLGIMQAASQLGCTCVMDAFQDKRPEEMRTLKYALSLGDIMTQAKGDRWKEVVKWWSDWVISFHSMRYAR